MVGFGYFSWLGFGLFQRRTVHFKGVDLQVAFLQKTAHYFLPVSWPISTSISAHRKKTTGKISGKTTGCRPVKTPFESWWFTNYLSVQSSRKTTTWTLQVVWEIKYWSHFQHSGRINKGLFIVLVHVDSLLLRVRIHTERFKKFLHRRWGISRCRTVTHNLSISSSQ